MQIPIFSTVGECDCECRIDRALSAGARHHFNWMFTSWKSRSTAGVTSGDSYMKTSHLKDYIDDGKSIQT